MWRVPELAGIKWTFWWQRTKRPPPATSCKLWAGCRGALPDQRPEPDQGVGQKGLGTTCWWRQLATSPQVYNFYPKPPLTLADEHLQIWLWPFEIYLPLPGQVPTSCRVGRRDDVTVLQMQQSEKPSTFSLNHRGTEFKLKGQKVKFQFPELMCCQGL